MNPQHLGFGSGSPMIGGGGMVAQQMENGAPALSQGGTNAPGTIPGQQVQPYPPLQNPGQGGPPPMSMMPQPQPQAQPTQPKTQAHLIIEALMNRLKAISELEHKLHDSLFGAPKTNG